MGLGVVDDVAASVINQYFTALVVSCTLLLPLSVLRALDTGWLPIYTYHCTIWAVVLGGWFARCRPKIKLLLSIMVFLVIGCLGIAEFGFTAQAEAALIVAMVFAAMGFGWHGLLLCAFVSVVICLLPPFALWLSPVFDIGIRPYELPHSSWPLGTLAILMFGGSAAYLVQRLNGELKIQSERQQNAQLEQARLIAELVLQSQRTSELTTAVEQLNEALVVFDSDDRIVIRNSAWVELNKSIEWATAPGVTFEEHLRAGVRAGLMVDGVGREDEWVAERLEQHRTPPIDPIEVRRQDGRVISVKEQVLDNQQIVLTIRDITERKRAVERLRLFQQVVMNAKEGIFITDAQGRITDVNPAFEQLVGLDDEQITGFRLRDLPGVLEDHSQQSLEKQVSEINALGSVSAEFMVGETAIWGVAHAIHDEAGEVVNRAGFLRDMTVRKKYEQRLEQLAFTDGLTGLVNGMRFSQLLGQEVQRHHRSGQEMALLYLDLDDFKSVNDSFGHAAGDAVLKNVAELFQRAVRTTDIVSRRGGDEFIILLTQLSTSDSVDTICRKLIEEVAALYGGDSGIVLGTSIGVAMYPSDTRDAEQLQIYADRALYAAKAQGKNCFEAYSKAMQQRWESRQKIQAALKHALANGQLKLHFQPIMDLQTEQIVAAEALLRWFHEGRYIPPQKFIPIAESSDLILDIDLWVINEAFRVLSEWRTFLSRPVAMHINMSAKFIQVGNVNAVSQALKRHSITGNAVCVEITETAVISDMGTAHKNVKALQALGLSVGLDDFGTGFSSLNHLVDFPINLLKIDRKFINSIDSEQSSQIIVESIARMARQLGHDVVAEGVETERQRDLVSRLGCRFAQGYLFGKPISATAFRNALRA